MNQFRQLIAIDQFDPIRYDLTEPFLPLGPALTLTAIHPLIFVVIVIERRHPPHLVLDLCPAAGRFLRLRLTRRRGAMTGVGCVDECLGYGCD
jgi:hypothetical protein